MKSLPKPDPYLGSLDFNNVCCGIGELNCLDDASNKRDREQLLLSVILQAEDGDIWDDGDRDVIKSRLKSRGCPYIVFSTGKRHGPRFAKFIRDNELGPVYGGTPRNNPTGSRRLRVWMWEPDYNALWYWYVDFCARKNRRKK